MAPQRLGEALLAELLAGLALRFGDSVRVERQRVAWSEFALREFTRPVFEEPNYRGGGFQPLHAVVVPEHECWQVPAVRVPQAPGTVIVLGEEQGGVGPRGSTLAEQLVHRREERQWFRRDGALPAQVGLQVGHQQRRGDPLPRDVTNHKAEPVAAQVQEVVIVAANLARLDAHASVLECADGRHGLRKQPGLYLTRDVELVSDAALRLRSFGDLAALQLDLTGDGIHADQRKRVPIGVLEDRQRATPRFDARRLAEVNAQGRP